MAIKKNKKKTNKKLVQKKPDKTIHYSSRKHQNESENKVHALIQEIFEKDKIIKEYQKQLSISNEVILKMTQQVDSDLQKLYSLHENLIPTKFPSIPNCEFSFKFISSPKGRGKDFYQVIPIKKMYFGLMMSSSVSHILSSLLFSSRLKLMSKVEFKSSQPADILQALVKEMHEQHKMLQSQIDIFYGIMNRRTYKFSYSSAGSIYAFMHHASNKQAQQLKPLAKDFNIGHLRNLHSEKISFRPRDRLILCTPGIVKLTNQEGEIFGVHRLQKVIEDTPTPGALLLRNKILHIAKQFSKGQTPVRDQSVVVMEIQDRILKLA